LARLIAGTESDALDEARAKEVGERLGVHLATDVADAHAVCCALAQPAVLVTSDLDDMKALAGPDEHLAVVSI
jgi:phosphoribosylcarboxyaminoimidazole (NCAIR) mutase